MSTVRASVRAEAKGKASVAPAREPARPDFVMLPIARKWGERRPVPAKLIAFVYVFTGISVFAVTALIR
jgi:hypothetical protein